MNDAVSRKAINELIKNRLSRVQGYTGNAEDIEDPFHRGKATSYENILYDISVKLPSLPSEGAEVRYREALEQIRDRRYIDGFEPVSWEQAYRLRLSDVDRIVDEALSHSGEPPLQSKSSMGLLLKEDHPQRANGGVCCNINELTPYKEDGE